MSDKDRRKKDGQDTNKKNQRMRAAEQESHARAGTADDARENHDQGDVVRHKSGAASDRAHAVSTS